jgi:hypothetical protein
VIWIRYKDFSAGTHEMAGLYGMAERCPRGVTMYLLPGLAAWQRRAVIRRLRQEASRGFGPPLPQPQLAIALGIDRMRTTARILKATIRLHPAVTLVPSAFVVAMVTLFVIASGDRGGITPGTRGGSEDAAVSGSTARASSAGTGRVRMDRVTTAGATGSSVADGERALVKEPPAAGPAGEPSLSGAVRLGAWHVCPRAAAAATSRPRDTQLACQGPAPRRVPDTAHLPGPLDFAR